MAGYPDFARTTVVPVNGSGPEDVVVDADGTVYTGLADGRIIAVSEGGALIRTVADTGGRPLGIELYGPGELLVCDQDRGLLVVTPASGRVRQLADRAGGRKLLACNNAAVAADGTVYFSDSSTRFPIPRWREDLIEQTGTGRLLRRTPDGAIDLLLDGLQFANGVALAPDESFVTVAETGACRVRAVELSGGTARTFLDGLPGHPDNSSTGTDGLLWITQASPTVAALRIVRALPAPLRAAVRALPTWAQPSPARRCGVLGVRPDGEVVHDLSGELAGFQVLTGVREHHGTLWFGSLVGTAIARLDGLSAELP
ncbi:SMP-30/gluconolactonase/LRE family protein [Amycolatopsis suaedae]|uniref:SMP-30/gluconolactonase/LRE family protein n=1 Tax=Amycolatopsis suaedae TaxID=2510978 RepID=A0A4Q7J2Z7_9PSEU|nr:SMP-30/gluconolactonase/LRE family protein [Amycolatopsis suaedae]RZQ60956.1 SMP-30/gluconolactonase/LRE family protein [Amycolatopsis suaedae]